MVWPVTSPEAALHNQFTTPTGLTSLLNDRGAIATGPEMFESIENQWGSTATAFTVMPLAPH